MSIYEYDETMVYKHELRFIDHAHNRSIVETWGTEAVSLLTKLGELGATMKDACPMPLDIAIEAGKKYRKITERLAAIGDPYLVALKKQNEKTLSGFRSNLSKGVDGDSAIIATCVNLITRHLPDVIADESGERRLDRAIAEFRQDDGRLAWYLGRKAELEKPLKKPDLKKWAQA